MFPHTHTSMSLSFSLFLPFPISLKSINISWSEDFFKNQEIARKRKGRKEGRRKERREEEREGGRGERKRETERYPDLSLDQNKSDLGVESTV